MCCGDLKNYHEGYKHTIHIPSKQIFLIQMLSPDHESERLDVLHQYQILHTPAEEVFDELTLLAANLCETPIALISLVDDQREWFKSKVGITTSEVPRSISFGAYTIRETEILIIPDILQDQRFAAHPLVICEPYFRAYAGVPLVTSTGFALGSLCVVDFVRRDFDLKEQAILQNLAKQVIRYLEIHREKISQDSQKCFNILCLNHQKAEVNLRSALAEKEVLLKEIHHRVKNSLQIVSSLLQLQAQTLNNPELINIFRESQNRIESIALIHKNLYTAPNIGQLNVGLYIQNLATSLLSSYQILPGRITLETQIDSLTLNIDQAIACGLIINELISNAIKHAFPNEQLGTIIIELHNFEHLIEMTIQDNGIGLPNDFDWQNTSFLGISLVHDLVTEQLEGTMTVEKHHGTLFKIKFPYSS